MSPSAALQAFQARWELPGYGPAAKGSMTSYPPAMPSQTPGYGPAGKGGMTSYQPAMPSQTPQPLMGGAVTDWTCLECGNLNYSTRVECNAKKCTAIRPGMKAGDWICKQCRNHNYANREVCNSIKCGAPREPSVGLGELAL